MDSWTDDVDERIDLERKLCVLTARQMEVVRLRILGLTHAEIGEKLEITRRRVGQIIDEIKNLLID